MIPTGSLDTGGSSVRPQPSPAFHSDETFPFPKPGLRIRLQRNRSGRSPLTYSILTATTLTSSKSFPPPGSSFLLPTSSHRQTATRTTVTSYRPGFRRQRFGPRRSSLRNRPRRKLWLPPSTRTKLFHSRKPGLRIRLQRNRSGRRPPHLFHCLRRRRSPLRNRSRLRVVCIQFSSRLRVTDRRQLGQPLRGYRPGFRRQRFGHPRRSSLRNRPRRKPGPIWLPPSTRTETFPFPKTRPSYSTSTQPIRTETPSPIPLLTATTLTSSKSFPPPGCLHSILLPTSSHRQTATRTTVTRLPSGFPTATLRSPSAFKSS